ncbi:MAG: hypothetical protein E7043_08085 [Lentisphaerae bacterium]|nr:hypothetical protein [Lentisphaerota bacterium]
MSFFRSLWGICCGPYIFRQLCKNSLGRVLWHLLLLCFLCSAGVGIGNYLLVKYRWRAAYNNFNEVYGSQLNVSDAGVSPARDPEKSRRLELPYNSLLIYVSPLGPEVYPDETLKDRNIIIYWSSACVAVFARQGEVWQCMAEYRPDGKARISGETDFAGLKSKLHELTELKPSDDWEFPEEYKDGFSSYQLFSFVRLSFAVGKAVLYFVEGLGLTLLTTLLFVVMFKLFSLNRSSMFSFAMLWKIAVYTAFPVLLVVNAFPALQLPGTGFYDYLFMIGWVGYLFFVLRYLVQNPDDQNEKNVEGEDGRIQ